MEVYKQRMISELIELHNRYCAAVGAMLDEKIPRDDRELIREQARHMMNYERVLRQRMRRAGIDLHTIDTFMDYKMKWRF